jgi:hypothetical protein
MTSCGYTPEEIDEVTLQDVVALFAYWRDFPPTHEILKCVYRIEQKQERPITTSKSDPSGIGGLVARFPNGFVRLDHDDFGLIQSKIMNVIDSKSLERDAGGKPVSTFPHPALGENE